MGKIVTSQTEVLFGRSDVAALLDRKNDAQIAKFADPRLPYRLFPSGHGRRSRGQRGLYTVSDVYKVALASRLDDACFSASTVAAILRQAFPQNADPWRVVVQERPKDFRQSRYLVVDWDGLVTALGEKSPDEWRPKTRPKKWVHLVPSNAVMGWQDIGIIRTVFMMPFDELMLWVEGRILGRRIDFDAVSSVEANRESKSRPRRK